MNRETFISEIQQGYTFKGDSIVLGGAMLEGQHIEGLQVKIPLKTINRHGLIAGATGTGKTKSLQKLAEQLSANGVGVLVMDIKGDLSGVAMPGTPGPKIDERINAIGCPWHAQGFPVELMTLSDQDGVRLRATVSEFGSVLLSRILGLNETQEGVMALVFKFCDDHQLPLLDLDDLKKVLQYITADGKAAIEKEYGLVSPSTVGAILRKVVELESQDAQLFFGEMSFEVKDLLRKDMNGRGYIHVLRLNDIQSRPKLFSTFMLQLLAEVYEKFPERGDPEQPELVIFIDEAHLVFSEASKSLQNQLEQVVKLIRSKGVGVIFCTQNPTDIPQSVLSQLGLKIQHALRAFTAQDRKAIKMVAENYPITAYYDVDNLLTQLGIGEAFVTALNEKGIPTPLVHTLMAPPESRMDIITDAEKQQLLLQSALYQKYKQHINRESAYEILNGKMEAAVAEKERQEAAELHQKQLEAQRKEMEKQQKERERQQRAEERQSGPSFDDVFTKTMKRQVSTTIVRELTRGFLGILKSSFKKK